jgi:hypothetical protein
LFSTGGGILTADLLTIAVIGGITLCCGLLFAAIAEYRRKDLIAEMMDEAERSVRHGDEHPCPWNLR